MSVIEKRMMREIYTNDEKLSELWARASDHFQKGNRQFALKLFQDLARLGVGAAYVEIGSIFEDGSHGVERDLLLAEKNYRLAIEMGEGDYAKLCLARILVNPKNPRGDVETGLDYLKTLSDTLPGASFGVGLVHFDQRQASSSAEIAQKYFKMAWENGHIRSGFYLGRLLTGQGMWFKGLKIRWLAFYKLLSELAKDLDFELKGIE